MEPRDADGRQLLGSLALGSDASSVEGTLPVLSVGTTDARAPRFIVIGAGVFPSHAAEGTSACVADSIPPAHLCEALRARLSFQIPASRDDETAFVDQVAGEAAKLLKPGLRAPSDGKAVPEGEAAQDGERLNADAAASFRATCAKLSSSEGTLSEFHRQGVTARFWRVCRLNHGFELCPSYPPALIVPSIADDIVVQGCSEFRSRQRLPVLTWFHVANGAAIMRSSQPKPGPMGQRSRHDEIYLDLVRHASPCPASDLAIVDCRPGLSASANMLKGGGTEAAGQGGYTTCTLHHCGINNIHAVRKALNTLVTACRKPSAAIVPSLRALTDRHWQRDAARAVVAGYSRGQGVAAWSTDLAEAIAAATSLGAVGASTSATGNVSAHALGSSPAGSVRQGLAGTQTGSRWSRSASSQAASQPQSSSSSSPSSSSSSSSAALPSLASEALIDEVGKRQVTSQGVAVSWWLELASSILAASVRCVRLVDALGVSVLVHCSDGWDRTSQVCATAKLLLDPYYRTIEGFTVLVQTDWLHFGHKFRERMGRLEVGSDEASPVFFQWLDCVHQIHRQFPERFEFTIALLEELVVQSQAGWGGSFLFDSEQDRLKAGLAEKAVPELAVLRASAARFRNAQYIEPSPECLRPTADPEDGVMRREWNRSLVLVPDFSEQALAVWPLLQRFDRSVYKAVERTQGAATPTLSMVNAASGGLLV